MLEKQTEQEQIQYLPTESVKDKPQVREEINPEGESLVGLARSLQETGRLLQPIRVRRNGNGFVVVDGARRLCAAKKAGFATIPVIIEDKELCEAEVVFRQLTANCQREDLKPLEKARAIDRLMREAQWSASQTAVKLGMSPATVSRLLALLSLPEAIQDKVASGALGPSAAYAISQAGDIDSQLRLADEATSGLLTRDGLVERTKARKSKRGVAKRRRPAGNGGQRIVFPLGEGRAVTISGIGLTIELLASLVDGLLTKIRELQTKGIALDDAVRILSAQTS